MKAAPCPGKAGLLGTLAILATPLAEKTMHWVLKSLEWPAGVKGWEM